ncbi:MAG: aspartate kinase [Chloroflexota bacterium]|nr:aspartate kinase [Chloroflexota bacterium]
MARFTMKFGGTSVGSPAAIEQVAKIVRDHLAQGHELAVVVSAMSGITDMLLESAAAAAAGDKDSCLAINAAIGDRHLAVIDALIDERMPRDAIRHTVAELLRQHRELCEAVSILGEASPRISDALVSFGERLSSRVLTAVMAAEGLPVKQFDSNRYIITDNDFQNADPLWEETESRITGGLLPETKAGITPVITGFIGATPDGTLTTLGRGGSDFSAAIFAACLGSDELIIWTDVDGVMTTDPRLDERARVLPYVSYQEIGELAFYGAKVLHPKTVQPIISRDIPLRVRNTFNPSEAGTLVGSRPQTSETVIKAVTGIRDVSMLTVGGPGMLGVPGIAGRTFLATASAGANILMISQASSEQSFCFTVVDPLAHQVKTAVERELQREILHKDIDSVDVLSEIVIITVVGSGMRGTPGVAGRVFSLLGEHGINVLAIAQGSSECSISFIVAEDDLERAVGELHTLALETVENDCVNGLASPY